jgi:dTDP-4-dehydrorhamnose reductase
MYSIILFGSTGMLGKYVYKYLLLNGYNIICINRNEYDASCDSFEKLYTLLCTISKIHGPTVIINCIGQIPHSGAVDDLIYFNINSRFPKYLSLIAQRIKYNTQFNTHLIHITTDCVFSGQDGNYDEKSIKDEIGIYGMSKLFGENIDATIIRTSIIGENDKGYSLLEWLRKNSNGQVNGYINHYWNGVTCLELAKIIHETISNNIFRKEIKHFYSNIVSKHELLELINEIYNLNVNIKPCADKQMINRTLNSLYTKERKNLREQILEMKHFNVNNM